MSVCHDLDRWLRSIQKHSDRKTLSADEVRARLHEAMGSHGLDFEQITACFTNYFTTPVGLWS